MRDPELFTIAMVAAGIYALVRWVLAPNKPMPTHTQPFDEEWPEADNERWHREIDARIARHGLHIALGKVTVCIVLGTLALSMCGK